MLYLNNDTYVVGDLHGKQDKLIQLIARYDLKKSNFIILGDCGVGFGNTTIKKNYQYLNSHLKLRDNKVYLIRGNHDNPAHWYDYRDNIIKDYNNIYLINDNEIIFIHGQKYFCIGGGTSIDRVWRTKNQSYWENEALNYIKPNDNNFYGILSHVGPLPPTLRANSNININSFYNADSKLRIDLETEKNIINIMLEDINPTEWYFGHYHITQSFDEKNTRCHCLDELQIFQIENKTQLEN